jgi:hypothetical protein
MASQHDNQITGQRKDRQAEQIANDHVPSPFTGSRNETPFEAISSRAAAVLSENVLRWSHVGFPT